MTGFKQHIYLQNDVKNRNLFRNKKCRFCDFFGYQTAVQNHEVQVHRDQIDECDQYELESQQTHLRFTNQRFEMEVPVVVYADFMSAINEKNKHKPIILSCVDRVTNPYNPNSTVSIPYTTRKRERPSSFH